MAVVDLVMPKLGESIMEATILKWHKKTGDSIQQDETLLDIATDKVDSEVPSTTEGIITEILFNENEVVPVGAVIARIETIAASHEQPKSEIGAEQLAQEVPYVPVEAPKQTAAPDQQINRFYSPLVLNIANSEGISMAEIEKIPGTGNDARVTKKDILQYIEDKKSGKALVSNQPSAISNQQAANSSQLSAVSNEQATVSNQVSQPVSGECGNLEMDRMRKMIAKHMVDSKRISPHVTSFSEADVTNMVLWRERIKKDFEKTENTRITFTPMFIDCVARVIKRFPLINCSLEGDNIIIKKDINIGMATATPSGNLIVPVIRNADYLNLVGLSKAVNNMAEAARNNKLKPDDTQGGTFTLTNVGTFGSLMGTPIINQPQVAILAVGAIKKRAVVIETEQGDTIGIRHMMYLSLSYDHRIVDGSIGASFLTAVAKELENWNADRNW